MSSASKRFARCQPALRCWTRLTLGRHNVLAIVAEDEKGAQAEKRTTKSEGCRAARETLRGHGTAHAQYVRFPRCEQSYLQTTRAQPPLHSIRAADAATLPMSRAHRPVPPARCAASPLPAMPSNTTDVLPARMEGKGAHPVNIVRQWLRQDARGFARITHDSDGALLTEDGRYGGREWQQRRGAHAPCR